MRFLLISHLKEYCTIFGIHAQLIRMNCNGMKTKRKTSFPIILGLHEGLLPSVSWHRGMYQRRLKGVWDWAPLSPCTMVRVKGFCSSLSSGSRCIYGNRIWSAFVLGRDRSSNVDWVGGDYHLCRQGLTSTVQITTDLFVIFNTTVFSDMCMCVQYERIRIV